MDWDKLRIFHAVAEAGSFTHAGEVLNLSQSAVSRQISALEQDLRVPLFRRHARGLILTEQGELLYRTAREVLAKVALTEAMIAEAKDRPKGPLTVTSTVGFATMWLAPRLVDFIDLYPEIALTLIADDRDLDLGMREADVAIRMRTPTQPDLIQRHLMTIHLHAYAAPAYLAKWGTPTSLEELEQHRVIVYADGPLTRYINPNWLLGAQHDRHNRLRPTLRVNSILTLLHAVESGLGIGTLPDYMIGESSPLVRVLPDVEGPSLETYFVYPEELRHSKRIVVFRDFLLERVKETRF